jgi:VWFA-related protein
MTRAVTFLLAVVATTTTFGQQRSVFRGQGDSVSVSVSVRNGNVPVTGLVAADFRLSDNGMPQAVADVSIEGVPIDLTLFVDTSSSFIGNLARLKEDLHKIARLLRSGDRFRLLAFTDEVDEIVPWTEAGHTLDMDALRVGRISSVYDGIAASMLFQPDPDRRHLIVAMTDGADYNAAVSSARLVDISARTEGVLHLVLMASNVMPVRHGPGWALMRGPDGLGLSRLRQAAEQTGGQSYAPLFGAADIVKAFSQAFDDFRTSYVLRYTPTNVRRSGWHELKVDVPSAPRATIRARRGYTGS